MQSREVTATCRGATIAAKELRKPRQAFVAGWVPPTSNLPLLGRKLPGPRAGSMISVPVARNRVVYGNPEDVYGNPEDVAQAR